MEGHRYVLFYAEALTERFGEVRCEPGISVRNDLSRQAEPLVYILVVKGCHSFSGDGGFTG